MTIKAYDSAYPGSMSEREDGMFIRRDDAESLASALLEITKSLDRASEDLHDALMEANKHRDDLLSALKYAAQCLDTDGNDPIVDAAIARARP